MFRFSVLALSLLSTQQHGATASSNLLRKTTYIEPTDDPFTLGDDGGYETDYCPLASPELGVAGECGILMMGPAKVSMDHGSATGAFGTVCIGAGGELKQSGNQKIKGDLLYDPDFDKLPKDDDLDEFVVGDIIETDLQDKIDAVLSLSDSIAEEECTLNIEEVKDLEDGVLDVTGYESPHVCIEKAEFKEDLVIKGSGPVKITVTGKFKVDGALVTAEMGSANVIWNIVGRGEDVSFSGGGGGDSCCKAQLDGNVIAIDRKISLTPGRIMGTISSTKDITLASGSVLDCPTTNDSR